MGEVYRSGRELCRFMANLDLLGLALRALVREVTSLAACVACPGSRAASATATSAARRGTALGGALERSMALLAARIAGARGSAVAAVTLGGALEGLVASLAAREAGTVVARGGTRLLLGGALERSVALLAAREAGAAVGGGVGITSLATAAAAGRGLESRVVLGLAGAL